MADEDSDIDLGEGSDVAATPAKKGIGGLLPTILKYVGLGVGAVILIVTVSLITVKIVTKNSTKTQQVPISEDFKEYAEEKGIPYDNLNLLKNREDFLVYIIR